MYGFDSDTKESAGLSLLEVGINENVMLKDVVFEEVKGYKTLSFYFEDKSGAQFTHREFAIDPARERQNAESLYSTLASQGKVKEPKSEFVEKRVKTTYMKQGSRIKHIATKFMDESEAIVKDADTFEAFGRKVQALFKGKMDDRPLRLLLVYNYKDYTSLPDTPPFIEVMADGPTELKITSRHRIEKRQPEGITQQAVGSESDNSDDFV